MFIKDMQRYSLSLHQGEETRAIGWLGSKVPISNEVPAEFMLVLQHLYQRHSYSDHDLGYHDCEICGNYISHGEMSLEIDGLKYIMPLMIRHYIEDHRYSPPPMFINRVLEWWHSEAAQKCRKGVCDQRPQDFLPGFHGKTYDSATDT